MIVNKALIAVILASGISGAAIKDPEYLQKRDAFNLANFFAELAGPDSGTTAAAAAAAATTAAPATTAAAVAAVATTSSRSSGVLHGLLGGLLGFLDDDKTAAATTAAATAAATTAAATTAADTTAAADTSVAAIASSSSDDDDGWFPHFTWPLRSKTTDLASTYTPTTGSSSGSSTFGTSTAESTETSSSNGGSSAVESYSEKSGGIAYSPYTESGQCKSTSQVAHDMNVLSSYAIIRLYGVDCSGVENTLAAISSSQKLFVGIYNIDDSSINTDLSTLKDAVESSSRGWDAIDTVSIGNELVNAGSATASQISSAVSYARSWFKQNASSYSGSIVSVDTLVAVVNNPSLCDVSDYLAVNCHPFWDGGVSPSNSGSWLQTQIKNLKSVCGSDKTVLITESGWPTQGDSFGNCVPSKANQLSAIQSIVNALGNDVLMFTTYNDYWKDGGSYGVEKYWGIYGDPAA